MIQSLAGNVDLQSLMVRKRLETISSTRQLRPGLKICRGFWIHRAANFVRRGLGRSGAAGRYAQKIDRAGLVITQNIVNAKKSPTRAKNVIRPMIQR